MSKDDIDVFTASHAPCANFSFDADLTSESFASEKSGKADSFEKRKALAKWIEAWTEEAIPFQSDLAFRKHLCDGSLLCKLVEALKPGTIENAPLNYSSASGEKAGNVERFRRACKFVGVSEECLLTREDLCSMDEERPVVLDCLISFRALMEPKPKTGRGEKWSAHDPLRASASGSLQASEVTGALGKGVQMLFQQALKKMKRACAQMPNYGDGDTNSNVLEKVVTPVLEAILKKVTQEYERRLLIKENELARTKENLARAREKEKEKEHEAEEAREEFNTLRSQIAKREERRRGEQEELQQLRKHKEAILGERTTSYAAMGARHMKTLRQSWEAVKGLKRELDVTRKEFSEEIRQYQQEGAELRSLVWDISSRYDEAIHKASRYNEVVKENRRLFNEVQDLRGRIRVFCRIRPVLPYEGNCKPTIYPMQDGSETLIVDTTGPNGKFQRKTFSYNRIFGPDSKQEEVYSELGPLIRSVCDGYSACIFAYGQTGSGKTYTMTGPDADDRRGVTYRALEDLFDYKEERSVEVQYEITVQMVEIYNEQVKDLLSPPTGGEESAKVKEINVKMANRRSSLEGLASRRVECEEDILEAMEEGGRNRATACTKMNDVSSRSHSITLINVQGHGEWQTSGTLYLVDLAGSERVGRSDASGDRLKEAQHINKSLSALGDVMTALQNGDKHVPYRNSKLTSILQGPLSNRGKAMMFVHLNPHSTALQETLSTLAFADRVSTVDLGRSTKAAESKQLVELTDKVSRLESENATYKQENFRLAKALADEKAAREREERDRESKVTTWKQRKPRPGSADVRSSFGKPANQVSRPPSAAEASSNNVSNSTSTTPDGVDQESTAESSDKENSSRRVNTRIPAPPVKR